MTHTHTHDMLKHVPGVDHLLEKIRHLARFDGMPRKTILTSIRAALDDLRQDIRNDPGADLREEVILETVYRMCREKLRYRLFPLINATGVVLHTNLGRALLCRDALDNIRAVAESYSNLELNIATGRRGIRYAAVEDLICELTGAESAMAVNNNAGAVLLSLNSLAQNTEVIVSRGELVEIGGSFRVPDVMARSGCILREVGTTNRTHLRDYVSAISEQTGLFLKVHASNYHIEGFTASVPIRELVTLGSSRNIRVMEDLGSGTFIDFSRYGLPPEPLVSDAVASGADVITFSGDKLLGGPQAGIIVGKKDVLDRIKSNPMTRALRIDKLTLAALEATLRLYRDEAVAIREIPALRMLTMSFEETSHRALALKHLLEPVCSGHALLELANLESRPGGGSFPAIRLPTRCVTLKPVILSVSALERRMRLARPSVIGRIENDRYVLDPRTLQTGQEPLIASTLETIWAAS